MTTVSVVIPVLNEEHNLPLVLESLPDIVTEVVIVDGGSTDRTVAVAREHRGEAIIIGQHAPGKGAATVAGLLQATGDIVVLMDGDCSMAPTDVKRFVDALELGSDVVHGSRGIPGGGSSDFTRLRSAGNASLTRLSNLLYGVQWTDITFGYAAMWRDVVSVLGLQEFVAGPSHDLYSDDKGNRHRPVGYGHGFEIEVLVKCRAARAGLKVSEVPSFEHKRRHGTSNLNALRDGLRVLRAILRERAASPDRYGSSRQASVRSQLRGTDTAPPQRPSHESSTFKD